MTKCGSSQECKVDLALKNKSIQFTTLMEWNDYLSNYSDRSREVFDIINTFS